MKSSSATDLNEEIIISYVHSKVIDAKKLRGGVHFIDALPMTPSAKVKRAEVRKIAHDIYIANN